MCAHSTSTDCNVFIPFPNLASAQCVIKLSKCVRVRHIFCQWILISCCFSVWLLVVIVCQETQLSICSHSACIIYFEFCFPQSTTFYCDHWKQRCHEESIKQNESQKTLVSFARSIKSVMDVLYAEFIRIQNRHDLHCQTLAHSKVNLVHTGHGYWLVLVLLYLWLRQSQDVGKWVGMCVSLSLSKMCVNTHMHTF